LFNVTSEVSAIRGVIALRLGGFSAAKQVLAAAVTEPARC